MGASRVYYNLYSNTQQNVREKGPTIKYKRTNEDVLYYFLNQNWTNMTLWTAHR